MSDAALELLQAIAARIDEIDAQRDRPAPTRAILTTAEAAAVVKLSENAFREWARRWRVAASGENRWPTHRVNAGLEREARQGAAKARKSICRSRGVLPTAANRKPRFDAEGARCATSAALA